ncbi:MAG: uracil-DNA glycosylase [Alphaproteobacteria bacterium]|nr:uracil-DNA glycosylase [Alphaproteobacteria bacterium]
MTEPLTPHELARQLIFLHDCGIEDVFFAEPLQGKAIDQKQLRQAILQADDSRLAGQRQESMPAGPQPEGRPASPRPAPPHSDAMPASKPAMTRETHQSADPSAHVHERSPRMSTADDLQSIVDIPTLIARIDATDGAGLKQFATQTVVADGNPASGIMIIGEAPGADEDQQGIPFIGQSGQLLMEAISFIGLDSREKYFISNSVFWRPPGNRTPSPAETQFCLPYLHRLIQLVDPKLVLILGGHAMKHLLQVSKGVSAMRGREIGLSAGDRVIPTIVSFHPSFLLRSPSNKKALWHDLLQFKASMAKHGVTP